MKSLGHAFGIGLLALGFAYGVEPRAETMLRAVDSTGAELSLEKPPQRIAALAPHVVEMLYALESGRSHRRHRGLCGLSPSGCGHPVHRRCLQPVPGSPLGCGTRSHCAVGRCGLPSLRHSLARRAPVFVSAPRGLEGVSEELRQLAALAPERAAAPLAALEADWAKPLAPRAASEPRVLPLVSLSPPTALGPEHFFTQLLSNCGARHALPDLPGIAPALSREVLFAEAREPRRPWWC